MTITFDNTGPAVTSGAVDDFEATLPGALPADYRNFLLAQNGGWPQENWWPPEAGPGDFGVDGFLSLGDVEPFASLLESRHVFRNRVPDHLLVVAYDENGNQLCLSLAEPDHGHVYFYDHELELDPEYPPAPDLVTHIADSFTKFVTTLEPAPDADEMARRLRAAGRMTH